jgi:dienelactone hydrolase
MCELASGERGYAPAHMAELVLFHHAQGLTAGCLAFADELRAAGHVVHVPDLYEGRTFAELTAGVRHADEEVGFETMIERGRLAAERLPEQIVYAGFSLGVLPAQKLAQTRPGARGALLFHAAIPLFEFGGTWPSGVPLQIHTMEEDEWGDVDVSRQLAETIDGAELFLYPGHGHVFTDNSDADYDEPAARLLTQRVLGFLETVA